MTPQLFSSVCILDDSIPIENNFGATVARSTESLKNFAGQHQFSCLALNLKNLSLEALESLLEDIHQKQTHASIIFFESQHFHSNLISTINRYKIFKILSDRSEELLFKSIVEAKTEYDLSIQNKELSNLILEQNLKLQELNQDLEVRIQKRQASLEESRLKLIQANKNYALLLQSLIGLQKATNTFEIERTLQLCLAEPFRIKFVKIQYQNSGIETELILKNIFKCKLDWDEPYEAHILFAKKDEGIFSKEEQAFLKQVSSAVALSLKKINTDEYIKELQHQWQVTFDSILEPVALLTEDHEIIQWNKAFSKYNPKKLSKCYKTLFQRETPCSNCHLDSKFQLPIQRTSNNEEPIFSVESEFVESSDGKKVFLNIYRDLSEQKKLERQILESSKMGELGLIGGSIAHELNNPLAGLLTFVQMLKQDIPDSSPYKKDIVDMEAAALRCKEIIQNLLSFTRKSPDQKKKLFIQDAINKALRVLQVKTKPLGIQIETFFNIDKGEFIGNESSLVQAFINIFQNSIESIEERKKQDSFNPSIQVHVSQQKDSLVVDFIDNGMGLSTDQQLKAFTPFYTTKNPDLHRGLGLTTTYQIVGDHFGNLDIENISQNLVRTRMSLPITD